MNRTPSFCAEDLYYSIGGVPLLQGVSFTVSAGESMVIAGRSGCGKSALLEICVKLSLPNSGKIYWEGTNTDLLTREERVAARRRIGFIFQKHALIHNFTIFDNIALPLRYHSIMAEKEIRLKVRHCMDEVGLFNVDLKFPNELSSGQLKSAALARALILDPVILFADEPTAGIDPYTEECISKLLNYLRTVKSLAIVMTCNDIQTIRHMKSPLKILDNGKLFEVNKTAGAADPHQPAIVTTFQEML
jgi:phospholipid/cholesterol/gamma-HCH transport system ATP-binding protein